MSRAEVTAHSSSGRDLKGWCVVSPIASVVLANYIQGANFHLAGMYTVHNHAIEDVAVDGMQVAVAAMSRFSLFIVDMTQTGQCS